MEKKRVYRSKDERPFPELSPRAEPNRTSQKLGIRVKPEYRDAVDFAANKRSVLKTQWLQEAIREKCEREKIKWKWEPE